MTSKLVDLKLQILDRRTVRKVSYLELKQYLEKHNWSILRSTEEWSVWSKNNTTIRVLHDPAQWDSYVDITRRTLISIIETDNIDAEDLLYYMNPKLLDKYYNMLSYLKNMKTEHYTDWWYLNHSD